MAAEWIGPPIYCTRCGLPGLVPVPAHRRGVPYWAIPVHRWPEGDFCTSGAQPLPGQYLPVPEGLL